MSRLIARDRDPVLRRLIRVIAALALRHPRRRGPPRPALHGLSRHLRRDIGLER
jgi:hypothetical protein